MVYYHCLLFTCFLVYCIVLSNATCSISTIIRVHIRRVWLWLHWFWIHCHVRPRSVGNIALEPLLELLVTSSHVTNNNQYKSIPCNRVYSMHESMITCDIKLLWHINLNPLVIIMQWLLVSWQKSNITFHDVYGIHSIFTSL